MLELVEIKDQGQLQPFKKKKITLIEQNLSWITIMKQFFFLNETGNGKKTNRRYPHIKVVQKNSVMQFLNNKAMSCFSYISLYRSLVNNIYLSVLKRSLILHFN